MCCGSGHPAPVHVWLFLCVGASTYKTIYEASMDRLFFSPEPAQCLGLCLSHGSCNNLLKAQMNVCTLLEW